MPITVTMPALSPTMTEGTLSAWLVNEGDSITSGDVIAEIETDKATMEVEAVDEGIVGKIMVPAGTEGVLVNTPIAILLEDGEQLDHQDTATVPSSATPALGLQDHIPHGTDTIPQLPATPLPVHTPSSLPSPSTGRIIASPLARRIAKNRGIDLSSLTGSGPRGRIVMRDIDSALSALPQATLSQAPEKQAESHTPHTEHATAPGSDDPVFRLLPDYDVIPHTNMRKTIARRLTESARDIPHFNVSVDVEMDAMMALRKDLNTRLDDGGKISVNDFIIKAVAMTLERRPDVNVAFTENGILKFKRVDIAIAVAIPGGLVTPIVKDAARKGLAVLSAETKDLAGRARDSKLKPEEYQGGTFSISNLGMFGVTSFNSIINPPQAAILSVGAGSHRPVVKDGSLATATVMTLTLAVDHRCIDGANAAEFIQDLKGILEDPLSLML